MYTKDIKNSRPGAQGPDEMQTQKKTFRALHAIGSPEWCEHTHTHAKTFFY